MNKYTKVVLYALFFASTYLVSLQLLTPPYVKVFDGSMGVTITEEFTIEKPYWDITLTYFKHWGTFWKLRVEIYEGGSKKPVFTTYAYLYTDVAGRERTEFTSHPSLPPGRYYLRVDSENANWSIKVTEWE